MECILEYYIVQGSNGYFGCLERKEKENLGRPSLKTSVLSMVALSTANYQLLQHFFLAPTGHSWG